MDGVDHGGGSRVFLAFATRCFLLGRWWLMVVLILCFSDGGLTFFHSTRTAHRRVLNKYQPKSQAMQNMSQPPSKKKKQNQIKTKTKKKKTEIKMSTIFTTHKHQPISEHQTSISKPASIKPLGDSVLHELKQNRNATKDHSAKKKYIYTRKPASSKRTSANQLH